VILYSQTKQKLIYSNVIEKCILTTFCLIYLEQIYKYVEYIFFLEYLCRLAILNSLTKDQLIKDINVFLLIL
jgi:hypothetical protein